MGLLYRDGLGTQADPVEAARWFYRAAVQDYPPAQAPLGDMFVNGFGVTANANSRALGCVRQPLTETSWRYMTSG